METHKICCFIGHREIEKTNELVLSIKSVIERLIQDEGVRTFAFGSRSKFNDLCHRIVTDLKKEFSDLERVFLTCHNEICILEKVYIKLKVVRLLLINMHCKKETHF